MPPVSFAPRDTDAASDFRLVHRRESGRELPWAQPVADDRFVTLEAPLAGPDPSGLSAVGRYLWITLKLIGNTRVSPRVRCIRAEYPAHDYLRRLPRAFSRDDVTASFLRRYLSLFEGFLGEIDARGYERSTLLNPRATPDEALPWLASFLGLVLDERWARAPRPGGTFADVRRTLIEEANWLFRFRGTVAGLTRFLEIYTGLPVVILEHFRLRGLGGGLVGAAGAAFSSAVVGGGFRVGGAVGEAQASPLTGTVEDAFSTHAHRFSVLVRTSLSDEQRSVVTHILDVHRPAHTVFELCDVGGGLRVGMGLHLGLSSLVGGSGAFDTLHVGHSVLGRGALLGRAQPGSSVGSARVGGLGVG